MIFDNLNSLKQTKQKNGWYMVKWDYMGDKLGAALRSLPQLRTTNEKEILFVPRFVADYQAVIYLSNKVPFIHFSHKTDWPCRQG